MSTAEAKQMAEGRPSSFLHVSRPEIDLPEGTATNDPSVYTKARENFDRLIAEGALRKDGQAHYYLGQAEKRGIRVSFAAGSRLAKRLGGTVRLTYGDGTASPRRWLHSGDGVLAQGAAGLVLGYAIWPSEIEFEWANGEKHSIPVRPETHDYVVP